MQNAIKDALKAYFWQSYTLNLHLIKFLESAFDEFQLTQISLNFQFFLRLKNQRSGSYCFNFENNYNVLKTIVHTFCRIKI